MLSGFYAGDDDYNASFVSVPHQVGISASQTTILSISPDPAFVGNATVVEFQVVANPPSGVAPTGNVTISDGLGANCTATVAEGQCTLVFSSAGNRWLTASYDGDGNFHPSENSAGCQVYFGFFLPYIAK